MPVASHLDGISTDEEASHVPRTFYEPNKVVCKLESLQATPRLY